MTIKGMYRQDVYELPTDSIRELIANAVAHRSYLEPGNIQVALYDDRLEITSPGMLLNNVTIEKMIEGYSRPRKSAWARISISARCLLPRSKSCTLSTWTAIKCCGCCCSSTRRNRFPCRSLKRSAKTDLLHRVNQPKPAKPAEFLYFFSIQNTKQTVPPPYLAAWGGGALLL